jgi:hypothetical protein
MDNHRYNAAVPYIGAAVLRERMSPWSFLSLSSWFPCHFHSAAL